MDDLEPRPVGPGPVRVLGMGNVLTGDDALGPYAVRVFEALYETDEAVEVLDVGTPGLDLTPYLSRARAIIMIDTVHSAEPPGSLRLYRRDQLLAAPPTPRTSPHEPGLREAIMITEFDGTGAAEVLLVGVVPETSATAIGLSRPVKESLGKVLDAVVSELDRLGLPPTPRENPPSPDLWWEQSGAQQGAG